MANNSSLQTSYNSSEVESDPLSGVAEAMDLYLPPCVFVIGSVCNILVIIVMSSVYFANVSTSYYIRVAAMLDNTSIIVALPFHWLYINYPEYIYRGEYSDYLCKVLLFIGWYTGDAGIAFTVAMTFERALAIKYPLHAPSFCTIKKARLVALGIFFLILAKDGHVLVKGSMVAIEIETHLCDIQLDSTAFRYYIEKVIPVLHNVFLMLSFIIIVISNVIIIRSVKRSARMTASIRDASTNDITTFDKIDDTLTSNGRNTDTTRKPPSKIIKKLGLYRSSRKGATNTKNRQLAFMLIIDSLTIMICTLPYAVSTFLIEYGMVNVSGSARELVFSLNINFLYVNRCMNFFLYCISGERFRYTLVKLFSRKSRSAARSVLYTIGDSVTMSDLPDQTVTTRMSTGDN